MKTIDDIVNILNDAYKADSSAVHALICNRVPCNAALADHETIVVDTNRVLPNEPGGYEYYSVGLLGFLNGVIEPLTGSRIAAKWTDEERPKFLGFCKYEQH